MILLAIFSIVLTGVVIALLDMDVLNIKHIWALYCGFCVFALWVLYLHRGLLS